MIFKTIMLLKIVLYWFKFYATNFHVVDFYAQYILRNNVYRVIPNYSSHF